jgi:4Fe-4S binding protein/cobalt chelatase family protein
MNDPSLAKFVEQIASELIWGQVLIRRGAQGYDLRHVADRNAPGPLRLVALTELRQLAQFTAGGAFRPLKAAPNLPSGWRALAGTDAALGTALNHLYPGAVADWFAALKEPPPVTHYRPFTNRQSGMYRITQMLSDEQAARMTLVCCHKNFCWKRRLWTVPGLAPDVPSEKSLIPCLEPCAVLLEFARRVVRLEQDDKLATELAAEDVASLHDALEMALHHPDTAVREADFEALTNPRRLQWLLEKRKALPGS